MLPDYVIKSYTPDLHRVVKLKYGCTRSDSERLPDRTKKGNKVKLKPSVSRARSRVLEIGLCNDWDYFITITLDKNKYDRYNLDKFRKDLAQWIRVRERSLGDIKYLFLPERHQDGAWHIHGLIKGDLKSEFTPFKSGVHPKYLVNGDFANWPRLADKFGFVSVARLRSKEGAARYMCKYISKAMDKLSLEVGKHLYFASFGLKRAEKYVVFGYVPEFEPVFYVDSDFARIGDFWTNSVDILNLLDLNSCDYFFGDFQSCYDDGFLPDGW